jgi:hypothetical protein
MASRRIVTAIAATATALALVTAGCSGGGSKPKASSAASGGASGAPGTTGGPPTPDSVATAFLAAWAAGDYKKAASFTDDPAKAEPRLAAVMKSLAPKTIELKLGAETAPSTPTSPPSTASPTPGATTTGTAPASNATHYSFNVVDTFDGDLKWTYTSVLGVVPAAGSTPPLVHWASAVINPQLSGASNLKATPPSVPVADDKGVVLTAQNHPSLAGVIQKLSTARPASGGGPAPSLQIQFVDNNTGNPITGTTPIQLGVPGSTNGLQLASTLDDKIQTAAEQALAAYPESGMVVIQPSTGNVLAIASNSKTVAGLAYHATRAPGSTFKTISAAALLQSGMKPSDGADCSPTAKVGTQTYHNDEGLKDGFSGATLTTAYEKSCNTSFVNSRTHLKGLDALSNEAKNFFGMNQPWDMGVGSATYCTAGKEQVPAADGDERFGAEMFGQGNITMCPLTMASVAATVSSGTFKQPVLIPGQQAAATAQPLPADVDANLKTLMQGVITNGTATSLQGISPTLGAKTGSAEPNSKDVTDSWMIAMDPSKDVAVAALVLNGGFGNAKAGPAIADMLKKTGL